MLTFEQYKEASKLILDLNKLIILNDQDLSEDELNKFKNDNKTFKKQFNSLYDATSSITYSEKTYLKNVKLNQLRFWFGRVNSYTCPNYTMNLMMDYLKIIINIYNDTKNDISS